MKRQVEEWMKFAKIDLDSAAKLLEDPIIPQSAAFHCQQSIEKSFKAILEEVTNKIPRIHDLVKLYGLIVKSNIELNINEEILAKVNEVYIETRYPSDLGLVPTGIPKEETVKRFYDLSKTIYKLTEEILS